MAGDLMGGNQPAAAGCRPRHVAVIPDGSRRWATARALAATDGYEAGAETGLAVVAWCLAEGVEHLSAFGSSKDNLTQRNLEEVFAIHAAVARFCVAMERLPEVALHVFGSPERLPASSPGRAELVRLVGTEPPSGRRLTVHVGVGYSGQDELTAVASGRADSAGDDGKLVELLVSARVPAIDLVIRTGGQNRLSGFLPWQTAYAELYFVPTLWPALTRTEFAEALAWYAEQDRRFGE